MIERGPDEEGVATTTRAALSPCHVRLPLRTIHQPLPRSRRDRNAKWVQCCRHESRLRFNRKPNMKTIRLIRSSTCRSFSGISAVVLSLSTINSQLSTCLAQGSLTPPGTPAPTMKTFDQIEPRKEVNATNTPGDSTALFIISSSGSYYLSGNIAGVSGKSGIKIAADDVTLDLNGFQLKGVSGSGSGIVHVIVTGGVRNVAVLNGTVRDWPGGGVLAASHFYSLYENLRLYKNGASGLEAGGGSVVRGCTASYNTGSGFYVPGGSQPMANSPSRRSSRTAPPLAMVAVGLRS